MNVKYEPTLVCSCERLSWRKIVPTMGREIMVNAVMIVLYGVLAHVVLLASIFDVYFQSPILHGIRSSTNISTAPARRVVLFIADGLRADKCFGAKYESSYAAPYLRSIANSKGVWGVSHTRVPTESRPGTVALVSGLYEDVSAITRGWKINPVEFDSVFNQSRYSYCWGSSDTLTMFSTPGHVRVESYGPEMVDFGNEDPSSLDFWVLERFRQFLMDAKRNETLNIQLAQDKVVFFFHLLGADIAGHTQKPWSPDYVKTIVNVDSIVNEIVSLMTDYFHNDDRTAFVFTSDHGMTDWGSHGSSDVDETETPFLVWGAGVRGPLMVDDTMGAHREYELNSVRYDVRQADVAPLMAILVGIPIPVNSVGVLPDEVLHCGYDEEWCLQALIANAKQLAAQFHKHWELKDTSLLFKPFKELNRFQLKEKLESFDNSMPSKEDVMDLMKVLLTGIRYFETYDRLSLSICVTSGFLGWMYFVILHLKAERLDLLLDDDEGRLSPWKPVTKTNGIAAIIGILMTFVCYVQNEQISYYIYRLFPVATWTLVINSQRDHAAVLKTCLTFWRPSVLIHALAIELLVITFFKREALAIGLFFIGLYPLIGRNRIEFHKLSIIWFLACTLLSTSMVVLTSTIGTSANHGLVCLATVACVITTSIYLVRLQTGSMCIVLGVQLGLLIATLINRVLIAWSLNASLIRLSSWSLLITINLVPLFGEPKFEKRLIGLSISLANSYLLLSYAHEALLCILLFIILHFWWLLERQWFEDSIKPFGSKLTSSCDFISMDDVRRAYFSLFLTMLAFFGLGNTPNVNSFSLDSVFPFVTVFSPFIMGALLLYKTLVPFLAVACHVHAVHENYQHHCRGHNAGQITRSLYIVLLMCDMMALQFFYLVRDEGSWLEIGSSLGRFVIAIVTTIGFAVLHLLAKLMMTVTINYGSTVNYERHPSKTHFQ